MRQEATVPSGREPFEQAKAECRKIVEEYIAVPPDREDKQQWPIFLKIARNFGVPGKYTDLQGNEIEFFGPVPIGPRGNPETLFEVRGRYLSGAKKGELISLPFFGEEGFLEPVQVGSTWLSRFKQQP